MRLPFLGSGSVSGISLNTASCDAVNFYYESAKPGEGHEGAYLPTPGWEDFTSSMNAIRAMMFTPGNNLLVVGSNQLIEIDNAGAQTVRGSMATSSGLVMMAANGATSEVLLVDGNTGKLYNYTTNAFATVSDADYPDTADTVAYINLRFLVNVPTTVGRFQWSALNDGATWSATDFATAESLTTKVVHIENDKGVLYIFGKKEGELWYDAGGADTPFVRFDQIEYGCVARGTVKKFDNTIVWLAANNRGGYSVVRSGNNFQPEIISTPELEYLWQSTDNIDFTTSTAYTYKYQGHEFYVINIANVWSFSYDAREKRWNQITSQAIENEASVNIGRNDVDHLVYCPGFLSGSYDTYLGGNYNSGPLIRFEAALFGDNGAGIFRRVTGPTIHMDNEARFRISEVQLDIEEGVADPADVGVDRNLILCWSRDNGHTFGNTHQVDMGDNAGTDYKLRLMVRKLGFFRDATFRVLSQSPRKVVIKGIWGRLYGEPLGGNRRV